ncbi:MAG: DEAD/DEAH box helicase [Candidatus ainarchaeum sp.]|nr:DEAD/DEAH box helicase [Candidatus ainarchaeum sp.]
MNTVEKVIQSNGFKDFNPVQKKVIEKGFEKNIVVSSPTASGKTIIAELFMIDNVYNKKKKVIYTCPLRALASEHYNDFKKKYPEIKFALSTGDLDSNSSYLKKFDVILTTYEKLLSLQRHKAEWLNNIGCLIVDEIHELDSSRGPTLEIGLTQLRNFKKDLIIVGLSATISNARELAEWLQAELIESNFRPTKLLEGICLEKNIEYNNDSIDENSVEELVEKNVFEKQFLFFLNSRKRAEGQAKKISKELKNFLKEREKKELEKISEKILNVLEQPTEQCFSLSQCIKNGVGFHHAGLLQKQRELVEQNFRNGLIKIICSTTTLCIVPETELWQGTTKIQVQKFSHNNSRILALKNGKTISVRPQQVVKNYSNQKIIEIESNSGHKIRVTSNHKMLIKRNNEKLIITANKIKKSDKIATVGKLWKARPKKYKINFFTIDNEYTNKLINPQIAYFIGIMLGDGHSGATKQGNKIIYKSNPSIISEDNEIFVETIKTCKYLNLNYKSCINTFGTKYVKLTKQKWVREFLVNVGIETGVNKHICEELKQIGVKETRALLQGLFDTDGCVEKRGHLSFSNNSIQLIKDIQQLLLTFGIVTNLRKRKGSKIKISKKTYFTKPNYEILIAHKKSIINFEKEIGFKIKRKQDELKKIVKKLKNNKLYLKCKNCNYKIYNDLFTGRTKNQKIWGQKKIKIIKLLGKEKKMFSNQIEKKLGFKPYHGEKRLDHHFELIKRTKKGNRVQWELNEIGKKVYYNIVRNKETIIHNYSNCPICKKIIVKKLKKGWRNNDFEKDIYWDFVKKIGTISKNYSFVYDVSLSNKNTDNLFVANGFIIHNSAGINTPADYVIIPSLYRYSSRGMELIPIREYKQCAGRSGRPKFSLEGKSIIIANNESQKELFVEKYINGEIEPIISNLGSESTLRTHVLGLIATNDLFDDKSVWNFFEKTLFAKQNGSIFEIYEKILIIIDNLIEMNFVEKNKNYFSCTKMGKRVSDLFLDPKSAFELINALKNEKNFDDITYLFAWANCSELDPKISIPKKINKIILEEFNSTISKLPFKKEKLLFDNNSLETFFYAFLLEKWINEFSEQKLFEDFGLAPGTLFGKNRIIDWLSYSTIELSKVLGIERHFIPAKKLNKRIKYGVKEELLGLVELKGIGRVRARKLFRIGVKKPSDIKKNIIKIESLLGKKITLDLKKQLKIL